MFSTIIACTFHDFCDSFHAGLCVEYKVASLEGPTLKRMGIDKGMRARVILRRSLPVLLPTHHPVLQGPRKNPMCT